MDYWICQHITTSSAAMVVPVPLTKADWSSINWKDKAPEVTSDHEDCCNPPPQVAAQEQEIEKYTEDKRNILQFVLNSFNRQYRYIYIDREELDSLV